MSLCLYWISVDPTLVVRAAAVVSAVVLLVTVCHYINTESASMYCSTISTSIHKFVVMAQSLFITSKDSLSGSGFEGFVAVSQSTYCCHCCTQTYPYHEILETATGFRCFTLWGDCWLSTMRVKKQWRPRLLLAQNTRQHVTHTRTVKRSNYT